ncbi:MAG: ABC transporter permease subunit [Candidatus Heimdallarchaeota archaeon]|nr:ABC transporter permease subunit [Candidatus Heimdallarchaeota archaeon]
MSMRTYALRRILYIFPTLLGISMISFALIAASPGDPIQIRMGLFKGEQTEYIDRYNEIGMEIGLLQKEGQDFVSYNIDMDSSGFSITNITIPGPASANIEHTTVTFYLTTDIVRNFSISVYDLEVTVEPGSTYELTFVANISSFNVKHELTTIFEYTATGVPGKGTMYVLEPKFVKINVFVRYLQWFGLMKRYIFNERVYKRSGILQGDFGRSWYYTESGDLGKPITDLILSRMWYTLFLTTPAFIISTILATVIGVIQATRQYSIWDKGVTLASLIGYSMPTFWLAKLVMLASYYLFNFTGAIQAEAFREPFILNGTFYLYLILPTITLVLTGLVFLARLTRSQLLDILRQDYIVTARAKGLSERAVIYKHAFRNALLPIITVVGMALPGLLGGAVMTEGVFSYPGLGTIFLTSSLQRDHPMMMATNFIFGGLFLVFRLLVDLSYALVDPRIRY